MPNFIQDAIAAAKKLPGQIVGGPVDLANLALGLATGKKLEGFTPKPVGGSVAINEIFGLQDTQTATEGLISAVMNLATPGGAAKTAIILPAILSKPFSAIRQANRVEEGSEAAAKIFKKTGVYFTPADDVARQVISDAPARLRQENPKLERTYTAAVKGPDANYRLGFRDSEAVTLKDILDHPELFSKAPDLANVRVKGEFGGWRGGSYDPTDDTIRLGATSRPEDLLSTLLHETQHAIQTRYDMARGGNSGMFIRDKETVQLATKKMKEIMTEAQDRFDALRKEKGDNGWAVREDLKQTPEYKAMLDAQTHYGTLVDIDSKAYSNYKNIAGEAEARAVQAMRAERMSPDTFPFDAYDVGLGALIQDPSKVRKVDEDALVRSIIDTLISPEIQAASKK